MPEITVTDGQRERLEAIRDDIEAAYVDTYGHTRLEDALEYLLDTYTPPDELQRVEAYGRIARAEYPDLQRIASDVDGVPGSGIGADEMRGRLLSELGADALAAELAATSEEGGAEATTEESATTADTSGETNADTATGTTTDGDEQSGSEDESTDSPVGSPLARVNELLDEHEEKWHESDGETPYEVELPDGTTEPARTKDDVRQLLFRHY